MANSINEVARLVKRTILTNLANNGCENLTPLVSGQQGIGKSQICKAIAKQLGGHCVVIEASMLSEGDAVGLPIVHKNDDGSREVSFVKHKAFAAVARLEKAIYEKAQKEGFLNGTIKIDEEGDTVQLINNKKDKDDEYKAESGKFVKIGKRDNSKKILDGEENMYKFGEDLSFETKLELLEKKEIQPVIVFIDELNRTDNQTMKELMNIILNKTVNGYELPWWAFIVSAINPCSQNSIYATNEMDPAQLDRFIKFNVVAKTDDWVDHCLERGLNSDLIQAVTVNGDILCSRDKNLMDETEMTPSPRSWTMIGNFMDYMYKINNSVFFTPEERNLLNEDFREIVIAKVGQTAGRTMLVNLEQKKNMIKPADIFTLETAGLSESAKKILSEQKPIQMKITMDSVVKYLCENIHDIEKFKSDNDIKVRVKHSNFVSQLKEYISMLDAATKTLFLRKLTTVKTSKNQMLLMTIANYISKDMLAMLQNFLSDKKEV